MQRGKSKATSSTTKKRSTKKATAVKPKPPVSLEQFTEEIRKRAQEIYEARGNAPGDALSDWLQAEREIKAKYGIE